RRPHSQRCDAGRPSGAGANEIRAGDQPQHCPRPRHHHSANTARARRRGDRMRRRALIALFSATAGSFLAVEIRLAHAQQATRARRIAIVHPSLPVGELGASPMISALLLELGRLGYVESQNLVVDRYSGDGQTQRYEELARIVVRSEPEVIFTVTNRMVQHFAAATSTIPIVAAAADPVAFGSAASFAR